MPGSRDDLETSSPCLPDSRDDLEDSSPCLPDSRDDLEDSSPRLSESRDDLEESFHDLEKSSHDLKESSHRRFHSESARSRPEEVLDPLLQKSEQVAAVVEGELHASSWLLAVLSDAGDARLGVREDVEAFLEDRSEARAAVSKKTAGRRVFPRGRGMTSPGHAMTSPGRAMTSPGRRMT